MGKSSVSQEELEHLAEKAKHGSSDAFSDLYEYFFPRLYRHVSFRIESEYVEDVVSDVFLKMVQNLEKYKAQKNASFSAWIFRITHNLIIDHYRKQREIRSSELSEDEEYTDFFGALPDVHHLPPDQDLQQEFEALAIKEALMDLKPAYREIIELRFLEEFSNKEIAQITGKSEGNIRIIQLRALKELRKIIEKDK